MELPLPARREFMTEEASLRGLRIAEAHYPPGLRIGEHTHEKASLTLICGGRLGEVRHHSRVAAACGRGCAVLRPAGALHANEISAEGVVNVELELEPALLEGHDARIVSRVLAAPWLAWLGARLRSALRSPEGGRTLLVEGLALEVLGLSLGERSRAVPPWLARAHDRITAQFRERLGMAALAREAGVHPVAFSRAFRRRYGLSPGELVRQLRLAWAADELRAHPDRPIAEIAVAAGYFDQSHFTRAFGASFGRSPAAHRSARH